MRIRSICLALILALGFLTGNPVAAGAATADPNGVVAGPAAKWFSGSMLSMWGLNCSTAILGSSYSEIMIQGYAQFGGAPSGGAPRVNETYYAVINLSEPGNPCGSGISIPELRLRLPAHTEIAVDAQHPVRCFVTPRFQSTYEETTNAGNWTIDAIRDSAGRPLTGPWCRPNPIQLDPFTWSIGSPALVNGTMHKVFVPIRSTSTVSNEALQWEVHDPVTYEGMQLSEARVWVFPASLSQGAPGFFFPDEAVIPFWLPNATPAGSENRLELFMNLYTNGVAGTVCFEVHRTSDDGLVWRCDNDPGYNGAVPAGQGLVQLLPTGVSKGPNGGYVPFAFDPPEYGKDYYIQWFYRGAGNVILAQSQRIPFRSLSGPDKDGDGIIDSDDRCPTEKGTVADQGCPPALPPDTDGDGVVGPADKCPDKNGNGALDGCPVTPPAPVAPTTPVTPPAPVAPTTPVTPTTPAPTPGGGEPKTRTVKLPKKLRTAVKVRSKTPKVCRVNGKGKKARVAVLRPGRCLLVGKKGARLVRVTIRVR